MTLEEQRIIRIDGEQILQVWTDIDTGEERYEGCGQVPIQVNGPMGEQTIPVNFKFKVHAETVIDAAAKFHEELQGAAERAAKEAVDKINGNQRKIQVPGHDQIIPFHPRLNGKRNL